MGEGHSGSAILDGETIVGIMMELGSADEPAKALRFDKALYLVAWEWQGGVEEPELPETDVPSADGLVIERTSALPVGPDTLADNLVAPTDHDGVWRASAIDWRIIFLLAGALALATALEKTGLTASLAVGLSALTGVAGPVVVMAAFFIATSVASQLMSNAGTVALLGPLAVSSAVQMGINPMALLVAVTLGASCSFATPIGYQTNLMVYGPGGYRFSDYLKVGLPLNVIMGILVIWLIPKYWPLVP